MLFTVRRVILPVILLVLLGTIFLFPSYARSNSSLNKQITICIPVYNAERTLNECLAHAAQYGRYQYLIYDNGSTDQTRALIEKIKKTYEIKTKVVPHQFNIPIDRSAKSYNVGLVRAALAKDVKTPYLFFLDSDVILSAPIEPLIKELPNEVGMVGYNYGLSGHLQMGATLLKTKMAQQIDWNKEPVCECLNARTWLEARGLTTKTMPGVTLRHDKPGPDH